MLLGDYIKINGGGVSVSTGQTAPAPSKPAESESFADILSRETERKNGVDFSGHALRRIESRNIAINENSRLERLNKGVELAAQKGSNDALVLIDSTAFVVSVRNNKVITALSGDDLTGSVFTNIDSAIIM